MVLSSSPELSGAHSPKPRRAPWKTSARGANLDKGFREQVSLQNVCPHLGAQPKKCRIGAFQG